MADKATENKHTASVLSSADNSRSRWRVALVLVATMFFAAALFITANFAIFNNRSYPSQSREWVDLTEPVAIEKDEAQQQSLNKSLLRVAIAPVISPEKSLEIYRPFVDYLAKAIDRAPVFIQRQTYNEINELLRNRRCDIALVCTYAFARGEREFGMSALAVPIIKGAMTYHSLILASHSSTAKSLLDLRNKRFASADLLSSSGWLYPAVWLKERREDADRFFSEHIITGSHDRAILAVVSKYVDGAAVDSIVYEQMLAADATLASKVKIIDKSPPFGMPPLVVHPKINSELRQMILKILLEAHDNQLGKRMLSNLGIERFVVPDKQLYDTVRKMADIWETRNQ